MLFFNYFNGRKQYTVVDKVKSDSCDIIFGVPQGSILGPLFFLIYINDLAYINDLSLILFADDTTVFDSGESLDKLIAKFKKQFDELLEWMIYNRMEINWSKTKFMIISPNSASHPKQIELSNVPVDVVSEFKLLGVTIDNKLSFHAHIKNMRTIVLRKLFAIKRLFFLPFNVKLQFFKVFILPHFDYCASIFIFLSNNLIKKLAHFYNSCIFLLLRISLRGLTIEQQHSVLAPHRLFPYNYRLFFRFSIFSHKILNGVILKTIKIDDSEIKYVLRPSSKNILVVPFSRTTRGSKRISIYVPKLVNSVLKFSYSLSLSNFKNHLLSNRCSKINETK